jgi:hypothetical protein
MTLLALAATAPWAAAAPASVTECVEAASACAAIGPYAAACVGTNPAIYPGGQGAFVCGGWFRADHPGCPQPPENGFDMVAAFTPVGWVRYFGGCHYVDGAKSTQQGASVVLFDPTSSGVLADANWVQADDPSGHSCDANATVAGEQADPGCPLGLGPAYVLPELS